MINLLAVPDFIANNADFKKWLKKFTGKSNLKWTRRSGEGITRDLVLFENNEFRPKY